MDFIHFASNGDRKKVLHRLHGYWTENTEQNEETEDVSIYKDRTKIPKDAVAEYYLASTLGMILPAMKVNDIDVDDANVDDEKENDQEEKPLVAVDDEIDDDEKE